MTKKAFIGALLLSSCLGLSAKSVKAPSGGKVISDNLIGIFFEDISFSADGGLYADLVQNGSFEYSPAQRDGWGPGTNWKFIRPGHSAGFIEPRMDNTIHPNNPTYMRIYAERIGHYYDFNGWTGVGMQNEGFFGMNIKSGAKYNFSVFFRSVEGNAKKVRIVLASKDNKILAETEINTKGSGWQKYSAELTANADCKEANLQILLLDKGNLARRGQDQLHGHRRPFDELHHNNHQRHQLCSDRLCRDFSGRILDHDRHHHLYQRSGTNKGNRYSARHWRFQARCVPRVQCGDHHHRLYRRRARHRYDAAAQYPDQFDRPRPDGDPVAQLRAAAGRRSRAGTHQHGADLYCRPDPCWDRGKEGPGRSAANRIKNPALAVGKGLFVT